MFDPLKRLLETIRDLEDTSGDKVEKIIFLGDYIDHGPSSREVMDLIMKLDYETVCLAGNHEDMVLRFMANEQYVLKQNGNIWSVNGYLDTYQSIFDSRDKYDIVNMAQKRLIDTGFFGGWGDESEMNSYKGIEIPKKYEKFLKSLRYSHQEKFLVNGSELSFAFFHALPSPKCTISEQKVAKYKDFNSLILKKSKAELSKGGSKISEENLRRIFVSNVERSSIWQRMYRHDSDFEGEVVIHGHTPTTYYTDENVFYDHEIKKNHKNQFEKFDHSLFLPFLFSRSEGAQYRPDLNNRYQLVVGKRVELNRYVTDDANGIEAINIDTGAVYGGALTALGLSATHLAQNAMPLLTVSVADSQRDPRCKVRFRAIGFNKLGRVSP
jgi:hypothetical protein